MLNTLMETLPEPKDVLFQSNTENPVFHIMKFHQSNREFPKENLKAVNETFKKNIECIERIKTLKNLSEYFKNVKKIENKELGPCLNHIKELLKKARELKKAYEVREINNFSEELLKIYKRIYSTLKYELEFVIKIELRTLPKLLKMKNTNLKPSLDQFKQLIEKALMVNFEEKTYEIERKRIYEKILSPLNILKYKEIETLLAIEHDKYSSANFEYEKLIIKLFEFLKNKKYLDATKEKTISKLFTIFFIIFSVITIISIIVLFVFFTIMIVKVLIIAGKKGSLHEKITEEILLQFYDTLEDVPKIMRWHDDVCYWVYNPPKYIKDIIIETYKNAKKPFDVIQLKVFVNFLKQDLLNITPAVIASLTFSIVFLIIMCVFLRRKYSLKRENPGFIFYSRI